MREGGREREGGCTSWTDGKEGEVQDEIAGCIPNIPIDT